MPLVNDKVFVSKFILFYLISIEKTKKVKTNKKPISLSSSVGVGVPHRILKPSHQIELVHDLEEKFRPRYKSDYFAQNGKNRKPRYVTDRLGNHFITLKVISTLITRHSYSF